MGDEEHSGGTAAAKTARIAGKRVRWNRGMKARFLDHLAGTCNIAAAARSIGVTPSSVYRLRRADAAFAEDWEEALQAAYQLLETLLVGHALGGGSSGLQLLDHGDPALGPIDRDTALRLMALHRGYSGRTWRGGQVSTIATREQTDAVILKRLAALAARKAGAGAEIAAKAGADAGDKAGTGDPAGAEGA